MFVNRITKMYTNHTKEEINEYLMIFRKIVLRGNYYIPTHSKRVKNANFMIKYKITSKNQIEMLLSINSLDFCYSIDNDGNTEERLYVFAKEYRLYNWGIFENVLIYIKIVVKGNSEEESAVIVSFHEAERSIKKLFV